MQHMPQLLRGSAEQGTRPGRNGRTKRALIRELLASSRLVGDMDMGSAHATAPGSLTDARKGLLITFKDLTCTVNSHVRRGKQMTLLSNVSGYLQPYEMTALMGPSGCGKTTLLDVLAGRKTMGKISGDIRFGGVKPSPAFLQRHTGYVEQFDTLISTLTVEEMLMYTAELKRPQSQPYSSKAAAVSHLLGELGLTGCKDVKIGDDMTRGISGGQAKRTNIGIALIANPRVLFLDEPTSGLDSTAADEVVELVKGLSQSGVTVVATIHSPSPHVFSLFDRVLLLARGYTIYFGPQGDACIRAFAVEHWAHFTSIQSDASLPEMLLDMVTEADRADKVPQLADAYQQSQLRCQNDIQLAAYVASSEALYTSLPSNCMACKVLMLLTGNHCKKCTERKMLPLQLTVVCDAGSRVSSASASPQIADFGSASSSPSVLQKPLVGQSEAVPQVLDSELHTRRSTSTSWWWGLWVLLKYRARKNYMNPSWVLCRFVNKLLYVVVIFTLYLGRGNQFDKNNLVNLSGSLFMWTVLPAYDAAIYVPSIVLERPLFRRERADGLYHAGTYFIAKLIEELVLATIISIVFSSAVFYGVKYAGSFLLFWLVYFLVLSNGILLGYFVAGLAPNMHIANAALPAFVTTWLFSAGQLATLDSMPVYWRGYSRINFMRYAWTALMANQFENNNPIFTDSTNTLDYYGLDGANKWVNMAYQLIFFAVFAIMGYLALAFVKHTKR